MTPKERYKKIFRDFDRQHLLVIGDVMLDAYLWGKVERISPEAPVPIVALQKRENRMGGAANVAMNIRSLDAKPLLCSVIGEDEKGDQFLSLMKQERMESAGIIRSKHRMTTTKFRIFGNNYQILRVDEEMDQDLTEADQQHLLDKITQLTNHFPVSCIVFQDYNKGVITPSLIQEVVTLARENNIPVTVDPKRKNFLAYQAVTLFKPNLKELKEGAKTEVDPDDRPSIIVAAQKVRELLQCRYVMTTLSEKGILLSMSNEEPEKDIFVPAYPRSVADVSGAGDTVISVASLCLASHCTPYEIAAVSNLAGGLVCEEVGVIPVNKEKLLKEVLTLL